jgi:hypothetical protein
LTRWSVLYSGRGSFLHQSGVCGWTGAAKMSALRKKKLAAQARFFLMRPLKSVKAKWDVFIEAN